MEQEVGTKFPGIGSIQPSEFMKVFLILALANVITTHHMKNPVKTIETDLWLLGKMGIVTAAPLIIDHEATGFRYIPCVMCNFGRDDIYFGDFLENLVPIFSAIVVLISTIFYFILWQPELLKKYLGVKQYQFGRIYSWLDPYNYSTSEGFHLIKSLLAIGSGQTTGKGIGAREVYLPESQTDFIFSVIGEEFGFIGSSIVISLFFLLIYHITKTGMETKNNFYTYICVGVISMITFHVFQNIGMTIGVMPITGIPLPFISYGGSSLMGNMMAMGLIFSIRYHYKKYMF